MDDDFIREELKKTIYNVKKVSRSLGLDYNLLESRFGINIKPIIAPKEPMPSDIKSLAKNGFERYIIAVRANNDPLWPMKFYNAIQRARGLYDSGSHEMCQEKRKDGWVTLYLIPRKNPTKRRAWFTEAL